MTGHHSQSLKNQFTFIQSECQLLTHFKTKLMTQMGCQLYFVLYKSRKKHWNVINLLYILVMSRFRFGKKIYKKSKSSRLRALMKVSSILELPHLEAQQDHIPCEYLTHTIPTFSFLEEENPQNACQSSGISKETSAVGPLSRRENPFPNELKQINMIQDDSLEIVIGQSQMLAENYTRESQISDQLRQAQKQTLQGPDKNDRQMTNNLFSSPQQTKLTSIYGSIPTDLTDINISYTIDFKMKEESDKLMGDLVKKTFARLVKEVFASSEVKSRVDSELFMLRKRIQEAKRMKKFSQKKMNAQKEIY